MLPAQVSEHMRGPVGFIRKDVSSLCQTTRKEARKKTGFVNPATEREPVVGVWNGRTWAGPSGRRVAALPGCRQRSGLRGYT